MTEISLIVTLNNQFNSTQPKFITKLLEIPPHISDIQQVLLNQRIKWTATSGRTDRFFIGKSDRSNRFQKLCIIVPFKVKLSLELNCEVFIKPCLRAKLDCFYGMIILGYLLISLILQCLKFLYLLYMFIYIYIYLLWSCIYTKKMCVVKTWTWMPHTVTKLLNI